MLCYALFKQATMLACGNYSIWQYSLTLNVIWYSSKRGWIVLFPGG